MAKKFQNLTVDYKKLLQMSSISDRVSILRSSYGQQLLSSITAEEYARLFPTYYKDRMPDISGFSKAMTPEGRKRIQSGDTIKSGTYSRDGGTNPSKESTYKPGWMRKVEQDNPDMKSFSDPSAKARLSTEHTNIIEQLKQGNIAIDDPRVGFLAELSVADREKIGINIVGEGDKKSFSVSPVQVTPEEIDRARKATISGKSNQEIIMKSFADELRKKGVSAENLPYAVAALAGQVQQESRFNPQAVHDSNSGYGIYGARDPRPGNGRKTDMLKWLEGNGYAKESAEGQARYMVHEAFTKYPQTKTALLTANKDNIGPVTAVLVNDFERPKERRQNIEDRTKHSIGFIPAAQGIASNNEPAAPEGATDDEIRAKIVQRKEQERTDILADRLVPKTAPEGVNPQFAETFKNLPPAQRQDLIEAINRSGVEAFNKVYEVNPDTAVEFDGESRVHQAQAAAQIRKQPLQENLVKQLEYAASQSGVEVEVTSGGQAPKGSGGPRTGSDRHDHGGAADFRLYVKDDKGKRRLLNMSNPDDKAIMSKFVESASQAGVTGIGGGYMGPHTLHAGGGSDTTWGGSDWVGPAHAAGAAKRKGFDLAKWVEESTARREASRVQQEDPAVKEANLTTARESGGGLANYKQANQGEVQPEQAPPTLGAPGTTARAGEKRHAERQGSSVGGVVDEASRVIDAPVVGHIPPPTAGAKAIEQAPPAADAKATTPAQPARPATNTPSAAQQVVQAEPTKVPVLADGGEAAVDGNQITAMPAGPLKGDNSLVVDGNQKPLFTMNTNKESAAYDPNTGKVSVQPTMKAEPEALVNKEQDADNQSSTEASVQTAATSQANSQRMTSSEAPRPNMSFDAMTQASSNPIHCPSFGRAMSAARMQKSGDGLGGHFDGGSTNLA